MGEALLTVQIALLLLLGRGLGEIMQRFGQPAVVGPLLSGLILGPSILGWIWPDVQQILFPRNELQQNLLAGLADVGVLMLLLLTGIETDLNLVRKVGRPAMAVTIGGLVVPLACGFALGELLPASIAPDETRRLTTALFLGVALSISSIKIVAMVIRDMNFMRRNIGQIIVASAIMEDTIGWVIIAITLGIAGSAAFAWWSLAGTLIGTALFLVLSYTVGRTLVFKLIRWTNDYFVSEYAVITAILLVMLVMALITQAIGVRTVLGAFVAGVLVGESPILAGQIEDRLRGFITAFLAPIFFGLSGLTADLTILKDPALLGLLAIIVAVASIGKFTGAFAGGRIGGLSGRAALALGCGMNARGSTEVIVATIGLSTGALTHSLYTMIVTMALITTMAMPPMLRWSLARVPIEEDEQKRLDQEDVDAAGFVSNFERILIAADGSANGKLASQFAGYMSGRRGLPMTVLDLGLRHPTTPGLDAVVSNASPTSLATQSADISGAAAEVSASEETPLRPEVITRTETLDPLGAVAEEAAKGFDVLFIGLERMCQAHGTFSEDVNELANEFPGPLALVVAGHVTEAPMSRMQRKILVPISGTEVSRRGAELAFNLALPETTTLTAVHIARRRAPPAMGRPQPAFWRRSEAAGLDDARELGARYAIKVDTALHLDEAPEIVILRLANRIGADLVVIGTGRRVGPALYLGETVAALMQGWHGGLVVLAI